MEKKKKALTVIFTVIAILVISAAAFIFTRPVLQVVTDPLPKEYVKRLSLPEKLTMEWRLSVKDSFSWNGKADFVIDLTKDGVETEIPSVRPFESPVERFSVLFPELAGSHITLLYNDMDTGETELSEVVSEMFPDADLVPYSYELDRSSWGIIRSAMPEDTVLLIPDLYSVMDFVRTLDSPRLAVDWLDAAALEITEPEFIASPDWDALVF